MYAVMWHPTYWWGGGGILAARYQQLFYVFEYILNEPESLDTQQHFSL